MFDGLRRATLTEKWGGEGPFGNSSASTSTMSGNTTQSGSSEPPKNGVARELYLLGRDNPEGVDRLFEDARRTREGSNDE